MIDFNKMQDLMDDGWKFELSTNDNVIYHCMATKEGGMITRHEHADDCHSENALQRLVEGMAI